MIELNERLWAKFQLESEHRKRLHNQIEDMKGKIRVYCRVRPLNAAEAKRGSAVTIQDQFTLKIKVRKDSSVYKQTPGQAQFSEKEFTFDACFGGDATQADVFEDTKMLIQSGLDGFNVCIFAYGQTGSGKTFTVTGAEDNKGLVPRSFEEMFRLKNEKERSRLFEVSLECYMVELYLDKLNDLLEGGTRAHESNLNKEKLEIREDGATGEVYI